MPFSANEEKYQFWQGWTSHGATSRSTSFMRNPYSAVQAPTKLRLDSLLRPRNPAIVQRGVGQLPLAICQNILFTSQPAAAAAAASIHQAAPARSGEPLASFMLLT